MKTATHPLLALLAVALLAVALPASAAPALLVETTITAHHPKGGKDVLATPRVTVESGKQAIVQVGNLEFAVTPTLLDGDTVDLRAILTQRDGKKADKLATPRITTKLGQAAEIQLGKLAFTTRTSLAK